MRILTDLRYERRAITRLTAYALLIALALWLTGCASTSLGKAVQSAEAQKIAVESAADEVIRIKVRHQDCLANAGTDPVKVLACDKLPKISDADYAKARDAYNKWAAAERNLINALITWKRAKDAPSDARLQAALTNVGPTLDTAASSLCSFKAKSSALATVCAGIGR